MTAPDPDRSLAGLRGALDGYPHLVEEATARVTRAAAQTVTGRDPAKQITVTATAAGVITGIRFSERALRHADDRALAAAVEAAANEALAAAENLLQSAAGVAQPDDDLDDKLAAFDHRMDRILDDLDEAARKLDGLA